MSLLASIVPTLFVLLQAGPSQVAPAQAVPQILVESRLAAELGLSVGDTVQVRALASDDATRPFAIAGIHERPADPNRIARNEMEAIFHLPDLETMLGLDDRVDRFAIVMEPGADRAAAAEWMEGLAFGTQAIPTAELAQEASATFEVVSRFHDAIGIITMLASSIFLLCLMVIRVDERRPEVRTMGLIGISRRTIFLTVVIETVVISLIAAGGGALLGLLITAAVNAYYGAYYETTLRFAMVTPGILWTAVGVGVALGISAGALAALRLVRISPQRLGER